MKKKILILVNVHQVAEILGCDDHRVYKVLNSGEIFSTRLGRSYRISKYSLISYLIGMQKDLNRG